MYTTGKLKILLDHCENQTHELWSSDALPNWATRSQNKDPYRRATYVGSFEVSVLTHVALCMLATIFLGSQWHFRSNKHAVLAGCSAFCPVNCIFLHKKTRTCCTAEWPLCYWFYSVTRSSRLGEGFIYCKKLQKVYSTRKMYFFISIYIYILCSICLYVV
jgi:hypothetical protein